MQLFDFSGWGDRLSKDIPTGLFNWGLIPAWFIDHTGPTPQAPIRLQLPVRLNRGELFLPKTGFSPAITLSLIHPFFDEATETYRYEHDAKHSFEELDELTPQFYPGQGGES